MEGYRWSLYFNAIQYVALNDAFTSQSTVHRLVHSLKMFTKFYVAPSKRGNPVSTIILSRLSIITLEPIHKEQYTALTAPPPPPLIHIHQKKQNKTKQKRKTAENIAVELAIEQDDCRRNRFQFLLRWIVVGTQRHIGLFYHLQSRICTQFLPVFVLTGQLRKRTESFEKKNVNRYFI